MQTNENIFGKVLWSGNIGVSLEFIGEGIDGDYNADDPQDVPLLRFYLMELDEDGNFLDTDGSACCEVSNNTSPDERNRFLVLALRAAVEMRKAIPGCGWKHFAGAISWKGVDWDGDLSVINGFNIGKPCGA